VLNPRFVADATKRQGNQSGRGEKPKVSQKRPFTGHVITNEESNGRTADPETTDRQKHVAADQARSAGGTKKKRLLRERIELPARRHVSSCITPALTSRS
jgi:hypothetical protein